jgi:transposase
MNEEPTEPWVPVGVDAIAKRLGVSENTVVVWRRRSAKEWTTVEKFPEPAGKISGRDWWWLTYILEWARKTGRLKDEG